MTAKDKAKELVDKFYGASAICMNCVDIGDPAAVDKQGVEDAKKCALIAVLEIEKAINLANAKNCTEVVQVYQYWQAVKSEIEKL